jgi:uncharacterized BrkB/YihY/UPF0761 family membrane protein
MAVHFGRKFMAFLMFLCGSAFALVSAAAVSVVVSAGPTPDWPPSQIFFSFMVPAIAMVVSGCAIAVTVAFLALPPISRRSTRRFKLGSCAIGLVLALPMGVGALALASRMQWGEIVGALVVYPLFMAFAYYATIRILLALGWLAATSSGTCEGCGYILAAGASQHCPECGRAEPSN